MRTLRLWATRLKARILWKIYHYLTNKITRFSTYVADEFPLDPVISSNLAKICIRSYLLYDALRKFRG